jgi:hypothetical protein
MSFSAVDRTDVFRETPARESEADLLRAFEAEVRRRLPGSWTLDPADADRDGDQGFDAAYRLRGPDGRQVLLLVEAKRFFRTREVPLALEPLKRAVSAWPSDAEVLPVLSAVGWQ